MSLPPFSWRGVIYYGEAVGFLAAWIVGLLVALSSQPEPSRTLGEVDMAAASVRP